MSKKDDRLKEYSEDIEKLETQKKELEAMWQKAQGTIEYLQVKSQQLNGENNEAEGTTKAKPTETTKATES